MYFELTKDMNKEDIKDILIECYNIVKATRQICELTEDSYQYITPDVYFECYPWIRMSDFYKIQQTPLMVEYFILHNYQRPLPYKHHSRGEMSWINRFMEQMKVFITITDDPEVIKYFKRIKLLGYVPPIV